MALIGEIKDLYLDSGFKESVLCWYPFKQSSRVLDLSKGILTNLISKKCSKADRHPSADIRYDYIIILDPLDFSLEALSGFKDNLAEHGKLLIAYENPFALRYWAGHNAVNTGKPYDTLFGRGENPLPSKAELASRLNDAGFLGQKWYYPLADHWLTTEIYSDAYLPDDLLKQRFVPYVDADPGLQFDERSLYREIVRGGAFEFMCGAYLVEARIHKNTPCCKVDYASVTSYREAEKQFATTLNSNGKAYKIPLHEDGVETVRRLSKNHAELRKLGVPALKCALRNNQLVMPRLELPTLGDYWVDSYLNGTWDNDDVIGIFDRIRDDIYKAAITGKCFWELVPDNCFYDTESDELTYFDQEYYYDNVDPDFAVTRAIGMLKFSTILKKEPEILSLYDTLVQRYNLKDDFINIAEKTYAEVYGKAHRTYQNIILSNVAQITKRMQRSESDGKK